MVADLGTRLRLTVPGYQLSARCLAYTLYRVTGSNPHQVHSCGLGIHVNVLRTCSYTTQAVDFLPVFGLGLLSR